MIKIYLVLTLLLFVTSFSYAGIVKEDGGNSVVCKMESNQVIAVKVNLLDFFEAEQSVVPDHLHFTHLLGKEKQQVLSEVIENVRVKGDFYANLFKQWLSEFESEAVFLKGVSLGVIPDSFHFILPKNCTVKQTAIQIEPLFHEARYTLDEDIWTQLPPAHQAGLLMHELIYRKLQDNDSRKVRAINAFLFSDEIRQLSPEQVRIEFKKLGFN
jgi:hypothetical protein